MSVVKSQTNVISRNASKSWFILAEHGARPGGTPRKIGWGCAARFPKPLPHLWPKSTIFPTLFMSKICDFPYPIYGLTKFRNPIYGLCGWHSCPKHNVWRAFVGGLIDNDEKVASCKKHTLFLTHFWPKWPKSITYFWPKRLKNHTLRCCTYLRNPYKWHPSLPGSWIPLQLCGRPV